MPQELAYVYTKRMKRSVEPCFFLEWSLVRIKVFMAGSPAVFAVLAVIATCDDESETTTLTETTTTTDEPDSRCNCDDRCPTSKVIGLDNSEKTIAQVLDEDEDGDGELTICARSRDLDDRTFPSICHMICFNGCTKFRMYKTMHDENEVAYVAAYRDS